MAIIQPCGHFRGDSVLDEVRKFLEPDEVKRLFAVIDQHAFWRAYFRLQYYFGCRVSEVAIVLKEDVDLVNKRVIIRRLKKKQTKASPSGFQQFPYDLPARLVPFLQDAQVFVPPENPWFFGSKTRKASAGSTEWNRMSAIRRLDDGWQAVSRSSADVKFRAAAKTAGIPDNLAHTHVLRHTRATLMLAAGARVEDVQYLLGHAQHGTTQLYIGWAQALRKRAEGSAELGLGAEGW